jgi:molybdate transport system substrate-binding protein
MTGRATARALLRSVALFAGLLQAALATEITVLSAGAVEPGIRPALAAFETASGHHVTLAFATAPQIRQRIEAGATPDLLIAPPAVLDALAQASKIVADGSQRVVIGRVGIGVAVRTGAPLPDISTPESLKRELLAADSLVFNRATTGLYFETVLKRLAIEPQVSAKATRLPDGAAVMEHVLHGHGRELGIGATTEILLLRGHGLQLVGPLPADLQNLTTYVATATTAATEPGAVCALMQFLGSPAARAGYAAAGIDGEPSPKP